MPVLARRPSTRYAYDVYGLRVASPFPLPELKSAAVSPTPDLIIRRGRVPADAPAGSEALGPFLHAGPDTLWLTVPGVARYLVRDGREIVVEPLPGADASSVRVFLLGSAMGAVMHQRGFLVLHGNAIRIGDACMVCVGRSGAGKSTVAAALMSRGYPVLADDVVPIDADGCALPGYPRLKLWRDTAHRLGIPVKGLRRIRPVMEKFNVPLENHFADRPLPVRWVYVLTSDLGAELKLEPIRGMDRLMPLRAHTYRMRFLDGLALKSEHLQLCGRLAGRIRLARVSRSEQGFDLDRLVDLMLEDVAAHPAA